jgi:cysteine synthase A
MARPALVRVPARAVEYDSDTMDASSERRNLGTLSSALDAIGNTPLVELSRITRDVEGRIPAKLQFLNPGGSKKDRIALQIIRDAEEQGRLEAGQPVVERTSGNTGAGLTIVCGLTGRPFVAVMSKGNSIERAQMMRALGAEVVLVDQAKGSPLGQVSGADLELVEAETQRIPRERRAFRADQFELLSNLRARYLRTGPEILRQADRIGALCVFVGTGGSFAGCVKAFTEQDPSIACYVVEPEKSPALAGGEITNPSHRIQGGGYSRRSLRMLELAGIEPDGFLGVTDEEAVVAAPPRQRRRSLRWIEFRCEPRGRTPASLWAAPWPDRRRPSQRHRIEVPEPGAVDEGMTSSHPDLSSRPQMRTFEAGSRRFAPATPALYNRGASICFGW